MSYKGHSREERIGELLLIGTCVLEGMFPVIAKLSSTLFPPFFFLGFSGFIAAIVLLALVTIHNGFIRPIPLIAVFYSLMVAAFVLTGFVLIFIGTRMTSGINTALLLQSEMLFAFLVGTLILREKVSPRAVLGAFAIFCGTMFILFNGSVSFNKGDLLIISATVLFPFGNIFAKKALEIVPAELVLLLRYLFGSFVLLSISIIFEDIGRVPLYVPQAIQLIIIYSIFVLVGSKLFWYGGLKRLPLSTSTFIIASTPAFGLVFASIVLREVPSWYQIAGFLFSLSGVYLILTRSSRSQQDKQGMLDSELIH